MKPNFQRLKKDILFEQGQLDAVVEGINKIRKEINEVNNTALAAYLMNFYNGLENIMKCCAKEYYKKFPKGQEWHKELLQQSCIGMGNKVPLFNKELIDNLYKYLTFRHFFIHGYGFQLKREKMEPLLSGIDELWKEIKGQLADFIDKINGRCP